MTTKNKLTIKAACEEVRKVARAHAAEFCDKALEAEEYLYLVESVSSSGMFRKITLAVPCISKYTNKPTVEFFWPSWDGVSDEVRELLGWERCLEEAAKAVDFSVKRRCFAVTGCGMNMVWATMNHLASYAYGHSDPRVSKVSNLRSTSMSRVD